MSGNQRFRAGRIRGAEPGLRSSNIALAERSPGRSAQNDSSRHRSLLHPSARKTGIVWDDSGRRNADPSARPRHHAQKRRVGDPGCGPRDDNGEEPTLKNEGWGTRKGEKQIPRAKGALVMTAANKRGHGGLGMTARGGESVRMKARRDSSTARRDENRKARFSERAHRDAPLRMTTRLSIVRS
jgi:hypothetical protein